MVLSKTLYKLCVFHSTPHKNIWSRVFVVHYKLILVILLLYRGFSDACRRRQKQNQKHHPTEYGWIWETLRTLSWQLCWKDSWWQSEEGINLCSATSHTVNNVLLSAYGFYRLYCMVLHVIVTVMMFLFLPDGWCESIYSFLELAYMCSA